MARLSPWLSNQSMCLRPVPLLTETLQDEQRGEDGKMKNLLSVLMMISTYALLMEMWKIRETEVAPCRSRQKWLIQSLATGLRSKARPQQSYLDLFLVHGVEPGVARLKVTELFSPPRPTALSRAIPGFSAFVPGSIFDLRYDWDGLQIGFPAC